MEASVKEIKQTMVDVNVSALSCVRGNSDVVDQDGSISFDQNLDEVSPPAFLE